MSQAGGDTGRTKKPSFPGLVIPDRPGDAAPDPAALGSVLSQLFQLRGYGRTRTNNQLQDVWKQVAGAEAAGRSKAQAIKSGVLQVAVSNSVLLGELNGYLKHDLLARLKAEFPELKIRDIKFRLKNKPR